MPYRLEAPCNNCKLPDRTSYACTKCEARTQYAEACAGNPEAIEYVKKLDYSMLGKDSSNPTKEWVKANTKHQARYEKKYNKVYKKKRLKGQTFKQMIEHLYKVNITLKATRDDFGVSANTMVHIFKTFSIPVRSRSETLALLKKKNK